MVLRSHQAVGSAQTRQADLDPEGRFFFIDVNPGAYEISASARDRVPDSTEVVCDEHGQSSPVKLRLGANDGVRIRGRVLDLNSIPLAQAEVGVYTNDANAKRFQNRTYVDVDRRAGFDFLVPRGGSYTVFATVEGYRYDFRDFDFDPNRRLRGPNLPDPSTEAVELEFRLIKLPQVRGQVLTASKKPAHDAHIYISAGPVLQRIRTDAAGQFRIYADTSTEDKNRPDFAEAWWNSFGPSIRVPIVMDEDWDPIVRRRRASPKDQIVVSARAGTQFGATTLGKLEPGSRSNVLIQMTRGRRLQGTLAENGSATRGAVLWSIRDLGMSGAAEAGPKGRFVIEGLPPDAPVRLQTRAKKGWAVKMVAAGDDEVFFDRNQSKTRRRMRRK